MIWPFTYDGEPCQIGDNIALVQALERCAAAYRNRCLNNSSVEHPNQMWVRLYSATERLKQAVCRNNAAQTILARARAVYERQSDYIRNQKTPDLNCEYRYALQ